MRPAGTRSCSDPGLFVSTVVRALAVPHAADFHGDYGILLAMRNTGLGEQFATVARALSEEDVSSTLETSVALATEVLRGCDEASVTLVYRNRKIETPVSTSDIPARGDQLQSELEEGPCLDVVWEHETVSSPDLAKEKRWPTWGPRVVEELGVRSMLCFQLFTRDDSLGALNLYSTRADAFTEEDYLEGGALAAQVAVALVAAREIEHLNIAVAGRTVIGQAQGILMERFGIDADRAFAVLQRVSSHSNRKLYRVADELVTTRRTPDAIG